MGCWLKQEGDLLRVDAISGELSCLVDTATLNTRESVTVPKAGERGCGRELFAVIEQTSATLNRVHHFYLLESRQ